MLSREMLVGLLAGLSLLAPGCMGEPADEGGEDDTAMSESAIRGDVFARDVFNWRFYLNAHADLLAAGIKDEAGARSHWSRHGIAECRRAHPTFHTRQYLEKYQDLRNAFGSDCSRALEHYLVSGRNEHRSGVKTGKFGDRFTVQNRAVAVGASERTAGAVDSVYWNGHEFINAFDHGRELQIAVVTDGLGECYNPTEAGGAPDGLGPTSTSLLTAVNAANNVLATAVQPAFWLAPGQTSPSCVGPARNTTRRSNFTIHKNVQVGAKGSDQIIQFLTQVTIPEDVSKATIEAPTGYLGGEFSSFSTFSKGEGCSLKPLSAGPGEQPQPLVFSTSDGAAAMGVYATGTPGYGRFMHPDANNPANATMKWNVVYRTGALQAGTALHYETYIAVGSLDEVRQLMCRMVP